MVAATRQDDPRLAIGADGHEMRSILARTGPVVDQDEVQLCVRPAGSRLGHGAADRLFHDLAIPASIGGASALQRLVGLGNAARIFSLSRPIAASGRHRTRGQEEHHHGGEHEQDDRQG